MTPERAKEVLAGPHHCKYPCVVMSETSTTTEIRQINDTNTNVLGSSDISKAYIVDDVTAGLRIFVRQY